MLVKCLARILNLVLQTAKTPFTGPFRLYFLVLQTAKMPFTGPKLPNCLYNAINYENPSLSSQHHCSVAGQRSTANDCHPFAATVLPI